MKKNQEYTGLSGQEVLASRERYGTNLLTPPKKEPLWKLFLENFKDPIIRILLIAAFLSLGISIVHNEYAETIGIFFAIFLATGIAFWFERDANKKFDVLNQIRDDEPVMAYRNGSVQEVSKKDIVVGDLIILSMGDEVSADGELLESSSLQIDESTLTGEPSIDKTANPAHFKEGVTYPSNRVLRSTKVISGHGILKIDQVGDSTEFGKVAEKATEKVETITPLNRQLDSLAKLIGLIGLVLAILTFFILFFKDVLINPSIALSKTQLGLLCITILAAVIALAKVWIPILFDGLGIMNKNIKTPKSVTEGTWAKWIGLATIVFILLAGLAYLFGVNALDSQNWLDSYTAGKLLQYFMIAVTLVVVAVPEGLPMSVTLSLALSMRRMLNENNLVRKMHACETMGATTVICTDKTGTLTQNQMQVASSQFIGLDEQKLSNNRLSQIIAESIAANSTAHLDHTEEKIKVLGNPTEGALLLWLKGQNIDYNGIRNKCGSINELPFSTEYKYMGRLVQSQAFGKKVIYIKGAPEVVLAKSNYYLNADGLSNIQSSDIKTLEADLLKSQEQAMRTIAFAYKIVETEEIDIKELSKDEMIFLGFTSIADPVRVDVPQAVSSCRQAGISIKIVTGDTIGIAKEIGRQIGIWDNEKDGDKNIIIGVDFEKLSDQEAYDRVKDIKIMCRARPTDKQRLVQLLKERGEIVAVTGDGTNDAPALNYADVGLSMGSGTSVAKEASDITLLDDSFASIATAVMWGRSLYQNIQRFILFQLTINLAALLIVFIGSIFGHQLPLTVTQMLWVNLIMDTFAAGALASLPPNPNVVKDKPRNNNAFIITPAIGKRIIVTGIIFVTLLLAAMYYFSNPANRDKVFYYIEEAQRERYFLSYFFTSFVMLQFWNLFNAKAYATGQSALKGIFKSKAFITVAGLILLGQIIIVSFGGDMFRVMPLKLMDWLIIIAATSLVLVVGEIVRLFTKTKEEAI